MVKITGLQTNRNISVLGFIFIFGNILVQVHLSGKIQSIPISLPPYAYEENVLSSLDLANFRKTIFFNCISSSSTHIISVATGNLPMGPQNVAKSGFSSSS